MIAKIKQKKKTIVQRVLKTFKTLVSNFNLTIKT